MRKFAKRERFARLNRQLPEGDFTQLFKQGFGVIRFANRNAAGADHHVGRGVSVDKRRAQFLRIVRNDTEVNHLAAQLLKHQVHRQTVGVVNLPLVQRLTRKL